MDISLGHGLCALIDEADAPLVAGYRWHAERARHTTYAYALLREGARRRRLLLHRLILGVHDQAWSSVEVDHINGNGLDNRRSNLRVATRAENARNHKRSTKNTSGYMGVTRARRGTRWCVQIRGGGKPLKVGYYTDLGDAARAYNAAAQRYFGAFARLNDVPEPPPPPTSPAPWQGERAPEALQRVGQLGHTLGPEMGIAGVPARQCVACLRTVVAHKDDSYGGSALREPCTARAAAGAGARHTARGAHSAGGRGAKG